MPGKFRGQRRLVGYGLWGCKESDITDSLPPPTQTGRHTDRHTDRETQTHTHTDTHARTHTHTSNLDLTVRF